MNFPTTRVQPEQIGEEPTDFTEYVSASSEENEYTPPLTLLGYVLAFIFAIASIAFSAGYWLNLY